MSAEQKMVLGQHAGRATEEILQKVCGPWLAARERARLREECRSVIVYEMDRLLLALEQGAPS